MAGPPPAIRTNSELSKPNVPIIYVLLTIQQAEERGVGRERLLQGVGIAAELLDQPDARIPLYQYGHVIARALQLTADPGLGYDFGLRAVLTTHGLVGLGVMSHGTLGDALRFGGKYMARLRAPGSTSQLWIDGEQAVIDFRESVPLGMLRQYTFDMWLVGFTQIVRPFLAPPECELWFEQREPDYYERFRKRLPPVRFNMGANQFRFPAECLKRTADSASGITAKLVTEQCNREMTLLDPDDAILARVRELLVKSASDYPHLEQVAKRMRMSSRTLKRRLADHGFKFRDLVDEVRRRDSIRLLHDTNLSVEEIASRVGYTAHGNFIRAFKRWTGTTPANFRDRG